MVRGSPRVRCKRRGRGRCRFGCGVRGGGGGFLIWGVLRRGRRVVVGGGFLGDAVRRDRVPVGLLGQCEFGRIGLPSLFVESHFAILVQRI